MKLETLVYDTIKKVIPKEATKTAVYANVNDTSYEMFFYSFLPLDGYRQCYELAEDRCLDAHTLDLVFEEIAEMIKADKNYKAGSNHLFTFLIDAEGIQSVVEYLSKDARIYCVKKEWKEKYLNPSVNE